MAGKNVLWKWVPACLARDQGVGPFFRTIGNLVLLSGRFGPTLGHTHPESANLESHFISYASHPGGTRGSTKTAR